MSTLKDVKSNTKRQGVLKEKQPGHPWKSESKQKAKCAKEVITFLLFFRTEFSRK